MKLIFEPSVYLVGRQFIASEEALADTSLQDFLRDSGVSEWETDTGCPAEELIEVAGRLCYMSFAKPRPGGNVAYLKHILEVGHGSVLEHAVWNFIITGVSRTFTHELVRHRAGFGFSQLSQRFVDESVAEYVVPLDLQEAVAAYQYFENSTPEQYRSKPKGADSRWAKYWDDAKGCLNDKYKALRDMGASWVNSITESHATYINLVDRMREELEEENYQKYLDTPDTEEPGLSLEEWRKSLPASVKTDFRKQVRQAARSVLPNATETKIFVTLNARSARHFIEMRASRFAEPEIRKVAVLMLKRLQQEAPNLFGDYQLTDLPDGTQEATTPNRKV